MLNFNLVNVSVPTWVYLLVLIAGLVLPLAFASIPIRRATRIPVRQALDDHGALSSPGLIRRFAMWPRPVRSLLRRPGRLLLTLVLLAFGGGLFVSAYSLSRAWTRNAEKMRAQRHYDVEVRVNQGLSAEDLAWVRSRPDLSVVEVWGYEPVALLHRDGVDVLRTYPDGGHGSSTLMLPPADTRLVSLPMLEGRWLHAGETGGVVLNHVAAAQAGGKQVGDTLVLYVDHEPRPAHIVGIAEEVGSAAVVYADPAFLLDDPSFQPRMLRLKTRAVDEQARAAVIASLDAALRARGVHVATVVPLAELRTAVGDHVLILVRALTLLAFIFAVVGLSGLLQAMGTAVLERTRELGVMKSLGASKARLRRMLVDEALWLVLASFVLSLLLAVPLTWSVCVVVGKAGFLAPLPFTLSLGAVAAWLLMLVGMSIAVTWPLSSRAANISVREALAAT
jgi:putative ABC transport system permease protein